MKKLSSTHIVLGFEINIELVRNGIKFPGADKTLHPLFNIRVTKENNSIYFDFHGSHVDYETIEGITTSKGGWERKYNNWAEAKAAENKAIKRIESLEYAANAFYCFVGDAVSGSETFAEFCSNLGYDEGSRKVEKIYFACQSALDKMKSIYRGDLYDLVNELQEKYEL